MSVKAEAPEEDPETRARRESAEKRADAGRIDETQDNLGLDTRSVLRQFGKAQTPALGSGGGQSFGGFGAPGFGGFRGFGLGNFGR